MSNIKIYRIKTVITISFLLAMFKVSAQDCFYERNAHEIGLVLGTTYYMGDFNPNLTPLSYPSAYAGIMYRYNFEQYFALRGQAGFGYLRGSGEGVPGLPVDPIGNDWRFNRPWVFADIIGEFNFMPYNAVNLHKKQRFTPVLLLGLGGSYLYGNSSGFSNETFRQHTQRGASVVFLDLPVGVGIKWCFLQRMTLGVEWMWRLTLYDNIDYYAGIEAEHSNPLSNDWIGTIGISISYLIKESLPCPATKPYAPPTWKYRGVLKN